MKSLFFWIECLCFFAMWINPLFSVPIVTKMTPFVGPSTGGTAVSIIGSGFTETTSLFFGTTAAPFVIHSDTLITATAPIHSPEVVFVTLTSLEGSSSHTPDTYFVYQGHWEAFVSNEGVDNVSIIDPSTNTVIATVTVNSSPGAIAIAPNGTQAYITNGSQHVSIIDIATNTVIATLLVVASPEAIAATPNGLYVYVANDTVESASVINPITNTVIATVTVGSDPSSIAIQPNSSYAYLTNDLDSNVSVIDTNTQTVNATVTVGSSPIAIAISPNGLNAYVVNQLDQNISVIETQTNLVNATVTVGGSPVAIAIHPTGLEAYVVNQGDQTLSVIDTVTNTVIATISVGMAPIGVLVTPDGNTLYVVNNQDQSVSVINQTSRIVIETITVGTSPQAIAMTPDGGYVYVANTGSHTVSVIQTNINEVISTIPVDDLPISIAMTPDQPPLARFTTSSSPAGSFSLFDASTSASPVGTIAKYFWDFGDGTTLETSDPISFHAYDAPGLYLVILTVVNSAGTSTTPIFNPSSSYIGTANNAVSLTHQGGPSATSFNTLSILPAAPFIKELTPHSSSTCGNIPVTITGLNFTDATTVWFGSIPAKQFTVLSDTSIIAIAPPSNSGTVDVRVQTPFGESIMSSFDEFTYLPPLPPKNVHARQVKSEFATQTDVINILSWHSPSDSCPPAAYRIYRNHSLTQLAGEIHIYPSKALTNGTGKIQNGNKIVFADHHRKRTQVYSYFITSVDRFGEESFPVKVVISPHLSPR